MGWRDEILPVRRTESGPRSWPDEGAWSGLDAFSRSPWQMMRRIQEEMDRLLGSFWHAPAGSGGALATPPSGWRPRVDISGTEREWRVEVDLPGVKREDIDVSVRDGALILRAETRRETGTEETGAPRRYTWRERSCGAFEHAFTLPEGVDEKNVHCEFRDGVLTVHLPKTAQAQRQRRRIPVYDVDELPSETASGRKRSEAELALSGAKGGETATGGRRRASGR